VTWRRPAILANAPRLAVADLLDEPVLAACSVLALASVLAPLLLLTGLQHGVIAGMRAMLLLDPRVRELVSVGNRRIDGQFIASLRVRRDVAFVAERTRTLSSELLLEPAGGTQTGVRVELLATAPGDPMLRSAPAATDELVLSPAAAAQLHRDAGAALIGQLQRVRDGQEERAALPLKLAGVAPALDAARPIAFLRLPLLVLIEDYQDGEAAVPADIAHLPPPPTEREYAGFRLYARRLDDVPVIDSWLNGQGIDTRSRSADVAQLLRLDRALSWLLRLLVALGASGCLASLGAGLWANVERKRTSLALLRFMGLSTAAMVLLPVAQGLLLTGGGVAVAVAAALLAGLVANAAFAGLLPGHWPFCDITIKALLSAAGLALAGAAVVSAVAGWRAARVEPWEGLTGP
jgi:putative ABC transport system permease protein